MQFLSLAQEVDLGDAAVRSWNPVATQPLPVAVGNASTRQ
jgi:hypothetical protein